MKIAQQLRRVAVTAAAAAAVLAGSVGVGSTAVAAPDKHPPHDRGLSSSQAAGPHLPTPPTPPKGLPKQPPGYIAPTTLLVSAGSSLAPVSTSTVTTLAASPTALAAASAAAAPAQARSWGSGGQATTLVLYDTTNTWGWMGELYAIAGGNLATHFGTVTAEPVVDYVAGQIANFTSTIYIGSTYDEPLPVTFLNDVLATTHPVVWVSDNIWQLSGTAGSTANLAFQAKYGWDPSTSYFDTTDNPISVAYKGQVFSRNAANGANVLAPHITNASGVTVLAAATCTDSTGAPIACAPLAQTTGTTFPWAIRSANLTYVGEVPFSYMSESDRYLVFADLLFAAGAPGATTSHRALVRLEDVSPTSDPAALRQFADYLASQNVPFTVGVIAQYSDPTGYYNGGRPETLTLAQAPDVVSALRYMQSKGGTIIQHGYTHQYAKLANPYDAVTGDDAEFYRAQCSTTQTQPYQFDSPCQTTDWVVWTGPLPGDSTSWAAGRATTGRSLFTKAGLAAPTIWETPHYFASAADYKGIGTVYSTRYERDVFVGGQLSGQSLNYNHIFGQFFPYTVRDLYGARIIPENLGNYEPETMNNNPPRLPADIIHNAQVNLAVTQGVASFFFHPDYPLNRLQETVTGIKGLGYTFVSATSLP